MRKLVNVCIKENIKTGSVKIFVHDLNLTVEGETLEKGTAQVVKHVLENTDKLNALLDQDKITHIADLLRQYPEYDTFRGIVFGEDNGHR